MVMETLEKSNTNIWGALFHIYTHNHGYFYYKSLLMHELTFTG